MEWIQWAGQPASQGEEEPRDGETLLLLLVGANAAAVAAANRIRQFKDTGDDDDDEKEGGFPVAAATKPAGRQLNVGQQQHYASPNFAYTHNKHKLLKRRQEEVKIVKEMNMQWADSK